MKQTRTGREWLQSKMDAAAPMQTWANQNKKPPPNDGYEVWQLPESEQRRYKKRKWLEQAYKKREKLFMLKAKWFQFLADLITHGPEALAFLLFCFVCGFAVAAFLS